MSSRTLFTVILKVSFNILHNLDYFPNDQVRMRWLFHFLDHLFLVSFLFYPSRSRFGAISFLLTPKIKHYFLISFIPTSFIMWWSNWFLSSKSPYSSMGLPNPSSGSKTPGLHLHPIFFSSLLFPCFYTILLPLLLKQFFWFNREEILPCSLNILEFIMPNILQIVFIFYSYRFV